MSEKLSQLGHKLSHKLGHKLGKFSPESRKILSNTAWLYLDRVLSKILTLCVSVWVARYLGPEKLGKLSYVDAFVLLFNIIGKLGLDQLVVRDIVRNPAQKDEILGTAFILKSIGGIITIFLTVGTVVLLNPGDTLSFWLSVILSGATLFLAFETIDFWFQAQVLSKYTVLANRGAYVVSSLGRVLLVNFKASLYSFAWIKILESGLSALGQIWTYARQGNSIKNWRWNRSRAKALLKEGWPLILTSFAIIIYMKVDVIMLGQMVGSEAVGVYSEAVRISEAWYFIPTALVTSAFPSIIQAKEVSESLYYGRLQKLFKTMILFAYAIALPMTFLAVKLVVLMYGPQYQASGSILAVHIWAAVFVFIGVVQTPWNIAEGLTTLYLQRTVIGAIINVALNWVLIPLYAGMGAAISTIVAYAFAAFILNISDVRTRKIFFIQANSLLLRTGKTI